MRRGLCSRRRQLPAGSIGARRRLDIAPRGRTGLSQGLQSSWEQSPSPPAPCCRCVQSEVFRLSRAAQSEFPGEGTPGGPFLVLFGLVWFGVISIRFDPGRFVSAHYRPLWEGSEAYGYVFTWCFPIFVGDGCRQVGREEGREGERACSRALAFSIFLSLASYQRRRARARAACSLR